MRHQLIAAGVIAMFGASAAFAQVKVGNTVEECLDASFKLAQSAEKKKLANDTLDKLEELLTKMEGDCAAKKFDDAAKQADTINKEIGG